MPDDQGQRALGIVDAKLRRDDAAERVAADDGAVDLELIHQIADVARHLGQRPGCRWIVGSAGAAPVEGDDAIELGEVGGLKDHPAQVVMPVQDQRRPVTDALIVELDSVRIHKWHRRLLSSANVYAPHDRPISSGIQSGRVPKRTVSRPAASG